MVIGLLANFSIIFIIMKNKMFLLQPANLLLLNMCISDFTNLLINPWLFIFKSGNQPVIFRYMYSQFTLNYPRLSDHIDLSPIILC